MKEILKKIELFKFIDDITLDQIVKFSKLKEIKKGECLFLEKSKSEKLFIVVKGAVSLYKICNFNSKKVIFILGTGKVINENILVEVEESLNCESLEKTLVLEINKKNFLELMSTDFELTKVMFASISKKLRRTYYQLKNTIGSMTADELLASKLWKLARDFGVRVDEGVMIDLNLTITYLADLIGTARETTSRQLKKLIDLKIIKYSKNKFIVLDMKKLSNYTKV